MVPISAGIDINRFSPDEDPFRKGIREKETVPGIEKDPFRRSKAHGNDRASDFFRQLDHPDLSLLARASRPIGHDADVGSILTGLDHLLEARKTFTIGGARNGVKTEPPEGL